MIRECTLQLDFFLFVCVSLGGGGGKRDSRMKKNGGVILLGGKICRLVRHRLLKSQMTTIRIVAVPFRVIHKHVKINDKIERRFGVAMMPFSSSKLLK